MPTLMRVSLVLLSVTVGPLYGGESSLTLKQGGICFRGDDNHPPEKWNQVASVFQRHGFKVCAALNLLQAANDPAYLRFVRELQSHGHEVMDHSPSHRICLMALSSKEEAQAYQGRAGVDHVRGRKVCFRYHLPAPLRYISHGRAVVNGNILRTTGNTLADWTRAPFVLIEGSDDLYRIVGLNNGEARLQTMWYENTVNLDGPREAFFRQIRMPDVYIVPEALIYQTEQVRAICNQHGIVPPKTWIQPGGKEPRLWRKHAAAVLGERLGYVAAAVYPDQSLKCFGEYDPLADKRFGMQWGDFWEDSRDLAWNKHQIAEGVARHYVMFGHSHLSGPKRLGGWKGVLERTEALLEWCKETQIPVKTYSKWAHILYDVPQDPTVNVFPQLDVDRDQDGQPDGITVERVARLLPRGGPDGTEPALEVSQSGAVCSVTRLAGLEKGQNEFSCSIRGDVGQVVNTEFRFVELPTSCHVSFKVQQPGWNQFTLPVVIPEEASVVDIVITAKNHGGRAMRLSQLSLTGQP